MTVIIDPQQAGISGNMVVGSLIDMGADKETVVEVMEYYASYFGQVKVKVDLIDKAGIQATAVEVECADHHPISYPKLLETLDGIKHEKVTSTILNFARKVFKTLALAESQVHGVDMDRIHFHEVGAADAVADIIGASYAFHELGLNEEKVYGLPTALGGGRIKSDHGDLTVPAPATMEILKNIPAFGGPVNQELTTPTGAALMVNMVDEFLQFYPEGGNRWYSFQGWNH
jgi:uncharacterized protein (TIGR00299 family) protein